MGCHRIFTIDDAVLITVVAFVYKALVEDFQGLCGPILVEFVELVILLKDKVINPLTNMELRSGYLPIFNLPIKLFFPLTNNPSPKMHQVTLAVIIVEEWRLEPASEVAEHVGKCLAIPVYEDLVLVLRQLMSTREHG